MRSLYFILALLFFSPSLVIACDLPSEPEVADQIRSMEIDESISALNKSIIEMGNSITSLKKQNSALQEELLKIKARNVAYDNDIARLNGHPQNAWYSVLLTAVAVIVTVLGVLVAIVAIFGAKGVKDAAINAAKTVAADSAIEHTKQELPSIAEEEIQKHFKGSEFYGVVKEAVEVVSYRGITANFQNDQQTREAEIEGNENV